MKPQEIVFFITPELKKLSEKERIQLGQLILPTGARIIEPKKSRRRRKWSKDQAKEKLRKDFALFLLNEGAEEPGKQNQTNTRYEQSEEHTS